MASPVQVTGLVICALHRVQLCWAHVFPPGIYFYPEHSLPSTRFIAHLGGILPQRWGPSPLISM